MYKVLVITEPCLLGSQAMNPSKIKQVRERYEKAWGVSLPTEPGHE